jgi:hypothetical protein
VLRTCSLAVLALLCLPATAESFYDRLAEGNAKLEARDAEAALTIYRDLQVERPESDVLYYQIACALYEDAMSKTSSPAVDEAAEEFVEAIQTFDKVATSSNDAVRVNARYNRANTVSQMAKLTQKSGDPEATFAAYREAIKAYEDFLRVHPAHKAARHNLDHMRYELKKMLQNPPQKQQQPQNEQQQNTHEQQGEDGSQQQDPSQSSRQDEQETNEQNQKRNDQENQGDNEKQQREDQDNTQTEQDNEQAEDQQKVEEQNQQKAQAAQQQSQEEKELSLSENAEQGDEQIPDRQTIEAILQSLEDMDNREQQEYRNPRLNEQFSPEWW